MNPITRTASHALVFLILLLSAIPPASAQSSPNRYDYGYCFGVAGTKPRVEFVTRVFVLGPQGYSGDPTYMAEIKARFNDPYPRETGCSMSPTAKEAEAKRQELIDGVSKAISSQPVVVMNWIPKGAKALSGAPTAVVSTQSTTPIQPQTSAASNATTAPTAGESSGPYWACAASGNGTQYDSAIFSRPNLFPQQIYWEYNGYLSKKYGIGSMPNCESRPTRAEAEKFLAQHAAGTIAGATSVSTQRIATGWIPHQLGGPPIEEVAAPPPPPAKPRPQGPTAFFACKSNKTGAEYTSAVFVAALQESAAIGKAFDAYLIGMFGHQGEIQCVHFGMPAEANAWINDRRMFAIRNHTSIQTTHWTYEGAVEGGAASASAPSSANAGVSAATTAAPQAATPKPVTPPPPKPAAANATQPKPSSAAKGNFVVCNGVDLIGGKLFFNPPVEVMGGDANAWSASYAKYLLTNYKYDRNIACSKLPTLAEAQSYYKETSDGRRSTTDLNGKRVPLIITNWKYP